ncbi:MULTISPECIES: hypothetical protein [Bradyrhizobium]|jgi:hypothetical protein|uniref:hypothetical protein n=1 Tax=Bradyrhizobium TaxID=374 RepID=UPI0004825DC2|nr:MULTISPECIES: hypothetical protein [Bradyrhizobium]MCS3451140.1 hypothetical protein [Bradyrhizobium elkanii]MCS3557713.1 hypothetical protein [Bradyrhizobium elkanii]MCW2152439.1 hypothetical protein [Bradyrhizobium elkanii]MCW2357684.1 hypothetical protein [Bradyrhizobium elkanii]MCW2376169.1 hypothetical protein [Bradyrhizobium elkanii]
MSQEMERVVASYLISIHDRQDAVLKLGLPLVIAFLSAWIMIRRWVKKPGIDSTEFSPAVTSALFAPVLLVTYFFVLQSILETGVTGHASLVISYGVLFAPTFLLLVPFGVASLVNVRRGRKALPNWLLSAVFAAWPIMQVTWALWLFGEWE